MKSDIDDAMKLVQAEGWNQTENDWRFLIEQPGNVCLAAEVDGKLVGTATAAIYSGKLAWIGMLLVNNQFRGKGVGTLLLHAIIQKLNNVQSVKLDATPAGREVYKKYGFKEEYRILRMIRKPSAFKPIHSRFLILRNVKNDLHRVKDFDENVFGIRREELVGFLQKHFTLPGLQVIRNNKIMGILLGRAGNNYVQLGPVSAVSSETAIGLVSEALAEMEQHPIVIDVLEDKKNLIDWLISVGFEKQRPFTRMYLNKNSFPGKPENQFLICGPEFG